jgi:hypothetical protein
MATGGSKIGKRLKPSGTASKTIKMPGDYGKMVKIIILLFGYARRVPGWPIRMKTSMENS